MYFFFGVAAAYTGMILSKLYMHYDSPEQPLHTYGDIAARVFAQFGPKWSRAARAYTAVLQALQLLLNVAVIILGSGQAMYQMSNSSVCFISLTVAFTAAGMLLGFIKQLRHIAHFANSTIWLNFCESPLLVSSCAVQSRRMRDVLTNAVHPLPPQSLASQPLQLLHPRQP